MIDNCRVKLPCHIGMAPTTRECCKTINVTAECFGLCQQNESEMSQDYTTLGICKPVAEAIYKCELAGTVNIVMLWCDEMLTINFI